MLPKQTHVMTIAGWILSGLVILFLLMDAGMKLAAMPIVLQTTADLGWPGDAAMAQTLGTVLLAATLLYAYPNTKLLGAVLVTAYLGGAVATHVRIGSPLASHILFGVYLDIMLWGGLWLREPRLRALFPVTNPVANPVAKKAQD